MASINLGNVVGLIKSTAPPAKTFVIWAKILDILFPNEIDLFWFDPEIGAWVPLNEGFVKISKLAQEFGPAGAVNDISILSLPAGYKLMEIVTKHVTAVSGGTSTEATLTTGITGELDKYSFAPKDVFVAPTSTDMTDESPNIIEDWDSATDIRAELSITGDTISNITAGEFEFYIHIKKVKR